MDLISTSWNCLRCGAAYISTPPEHGLCGQCIADLEALAALQALAAPRPCPACGGPVCADCGKALLLLLPGFGLTDHAGEVTGDGG